MVCSGALGFILLFLLQPASGVDNLYNIIDHLQCNYGVYNQYALGINVPRGYCDQDAPLDQNFLPRDNAQRVRFKMAGIERIYKGIRLIGARPKPINRYSQNKYHSEYLLLINSMSRRLRRFDPLMETLLNSNPDGCTVFFTLNSPCVKTCSTPNGRYSIIPALEMFQNHKGPKAFVFNQVWGPDKNDPEWQNNIRAINDLIPVYRCDSGQCAPCVNNNAVDEWCM